MSRALSITTVARTATVACLLLGCALDAHARQTEAPDTLPTLRNANALVDALTENYPLSMRRDAIGGTARIQVRVNTDGKVDSTWVAYSSGLYGLDLAASRTARSARFDPARRDGAKVPAWTELPFRFSTGHERNPEPQHVPVLNRADVVAGSAAHRPRDLVASGTGASVGFRLDIDSAGMPVRISLVETSCMDGPDAAALAIVRQLTFAPDHDGIGATRPTYASVHFGMDSLAVRLVGDALRPSRDTTTSDSSSRENSNAKSKRPLLTNRPHIARLLEQYYPPDLRALGVGGDVHVLIHIDEQGAVTYKEVSRSSGECKLDAAALLVTRNMRFEPGVNRGERVPVWVEIPIFFRSR